MLWFENRGAIQQHHVCPPKWRFFPSIKTNFLQPSILDYVSAIRTFNVEADFPTVDEARRLVIAEIKRAKKEGVRILKVIHGYGSSGKGGALCVGLRKSFVLRKKEGVIKDFVCGEEFSIFDAATLSMLEAAPALRGDPDLNATNEGVSLLWIK